MSILLKSYSYWPNFSYCLDFSLLRAQESRHYCPATFLFLFSNSKVANSKISLNFLFSALSFCFSLKACRNSVQESFLEQKGLAESFSIVSLRKGKTKQNKIFSACIFFLFNIQYTIKYRHMPVCTFFFLIYNKIAKGARICMDSLIDF